MLSIQAQRGNLVSLFAVFTEITLQSNSGTSKCDMFILGISVDVGGAISCVCSAMVAIAAYANYPVFSFYFKHVALPLLEIQKA